MVESVLSIRFEGEECDFYVVGTAILEADVEEPDKGRLVVFQYKDNELELVASVEVDGSVFTMCAMNGRLVAGIKNKVNAKRCPLFDLSLI
jgi:hypothetical protein